MGATRKPRWARLGQWGISARSAFVAATVVFVTLGLAGAGTALVLYQSMLASVDSAAEARASEIAGVLSTRGIDALEPALVEPDQRIVAVQVLRDDGTVVQRSDSAPDTPMVPVADIGEGLLVDIPDEETPYGAIRFTARSVDGPDGRFKVLVGEDSQTVGATVASVVIALAIAAPVIIAVAAAATYLLVRRSMRSVDEIRSRVADISTSDLTERVPVPDSRDEIAALAVTMNEMLARIEAGHAAQRRFVADASHELRSPLTTIISALEVAGEHPELLAEVVSSDTLMPEAQRMRALVDDLLLLARADENGLALALRHDDVDLDDILGRETERLRRETQLRIVSDVHPVRVCGDADAMSRVVRNLADNAARHASGLVELHLRSDDGHAVIEIRDDGPGIPAAERERVFQRFVRLDPTRSRGGGGSGLGLAIVAEIVAAHDGSVRIDDRRGGGAVVRIQLPVTNFPDSSR